MTLPFVVVNIMGLTQSCFISVWSEGIGGGKGGTLSSEKLSSGKLPASEGSGSVGWGSSSALQMVTGGCSSVPESDGGFSSAVLWYLFRCMPFTLSTTCMVNCKGKKGVRMLFW